MAQPARGSNPSISTMRLVSIGLVSSVLFSATFVLNYSMSLAGGHWAWSGIIRYAFTILLLCLLIGWREGFTGLAAVFGVFRKHLAFWLLLGTVGVGLFYAPLCFAADHARGWVIASTWQITVLASPIVLLLFGFSFPKLGILFSSTIVFGVCLVNYQSFQGGLANGELLYGVVPVLLAAFTYPIANQLLNAAKNGTLSYVPTIRSRVIESSLACALLMSLGSIPFWLALYAITAPPPPSLGQFISTFFVALLSGVCATGLFVYARNLTSSPYKIAAVDATLSGEVVVTLVAELAFLNPTLPAPLSLVGVVFIMAGLMGYCLRVSRGVGSHSRTEEI